MRALPGGRLILQILIWMAVSRLQAFAAATDPPAMTMSAPSESDKGKPLASPGCDAPQDKQLAESGPDALGPGGRGELGESEGNAPGPLVWGIAGLRGYAFGQQVAPNGLEFNPLFSLDLNLNLWLWRQERIYTFVDTRFWGQKAAPGVTNASQGVFDFSKREFDLDLGLAWNYWGMLEARTFAYSFNNLNRGSSDNHPSGYNDGVGLENRLYVGGTYADLGQPGFDVARATFLSVGFYPTKDMVDADGNTFQPGPFARAYVTLDLLDEGRCYLYLDTQFIGTRSFGAKLLDIDGGIAARPFPRVPYLEFRLGSEDTYDLQLRETETSLYVAVRFRF
jgi:hypothetical protein